MQNPGEEIRTALTTERENRIKRWFLLTGRRMSVMVVLMGLVFLGLITLALVRPIDMVQLLDETAAARTLFSSLLSGAILLVSIVVSISSITLTKEITDIEDQRRRIDASLEYHRQVEGFIQVPVTPARPVEFLHAVLFSVSTQVTHLVELADERGQGEYDEDRTEFATHVAQEIDIARNTLSGASYGGFRVLLAGLNYDYSGQLHVARGLRETHGEEFSEEERETLENIIDTLKILGIGREYFKSLYFKREFSKLSSHLLYVTLPVIVFTSYVILAMDANFIPPVTFFGIPPLVLALATAYTIALAPYILLTTYVIRAATITLRTLAAGPFIFQRGTDGNTLEWENVDPSREWDLEEVLDQE